MKILGWITMPSKFPAACCLILFCCNARAENTAGTVRSSSLRSSQTSAGRTESSIDNTIDIIMRRNGRDQVHRLVLYLVVVFYTTIFLIFVARPFFSSFFSFLIFIRCLWMRCALCVHVNLFYVMTVVDCLLFANVLFRFISSLSSQ